MSYLRSSIYVLFPQILSYGSLFIVTYFPTYCFVKKSSSRFIIMTGHISVFWMSVF